MNGEEAVCSRCGMRKNVAEFYADKNALRGRKSECKECSKRVTRERYRKIMSDPEKAGRLRKRMSRYSRSARFKAAQRRYHQSPRGKATRLRYLQSPKGLAMLRRSRQRRKRKERSTV